MSYRTQNTRPVTTVAQRLADADAVPTTVQIEELRTAALDTLNPMSHVNIARLVEAVMGVTLVDGEFVQGPGANYAKAYAIVGALRKRTVVKAAPAVPAEASFNDEEEPFNNNSTPPVAEVKKARAPRAPKAPKA